MSLRKTERERERERQRERETDRETDRDRERHSLRLNKTGNKIKLILRRELNGVCELKNKEIDEM